MGIGRQLAPTGVSTSTNFHNLDHKPDDLSGVWFVLCLLGLASICGGI